MATRLQGQARIDTICWYLAGAENDWGIRKALILPLAKDLIGGIGKFRQPVSGRHLTGVRRISIHERRWYYHMRKT